MPPILSKTKERFRLVASGCIKTAHAPTGVIPDKPKRGQQFAVEFLRLLQIAYAQIDVIKVSVFFHSCRSRFRPPPRVGEPIEPEDKLRFVPKPALSPGKSWKPRQNILKNKPETANWCEAANGSGTRPPTLRHQKGDILRR